MKPLFWIRNLISSGRRARPIGHVEILQQQLAEAQQQAETLAQIHHLTSVYAITINPFDPDTE